LLVVANVVEPSLSEGVVLDNKGSVSELPVASVVPLPLPLPLPLSSLRSPVVVSRNVQQGVPPVPR